MRSIKGREKMTHCFNCCESHLIFDENWEKNDQKLERYFRIYWKFRDNFIKSGISVRFYDSVFQQFAHLRLQAFELMFWILALLFSMIHYLSTPAPSTDVFKFSPPEIRLSEDVPLPHWVLITEIHLLYPSSLQLSILNGVVSFLSICCSSIKSRFCIYSIHKYLLDLPDNSSHKTDNWSIQVHDNHILCCGNSVHFHESHVASVSSFA